MIPQILSKSTKKDWTLEKNVLKTDGGQLEWKLDLKRRQIFLPLVRNKEKILLNCVRWNNSRIDNETRINWTFNEGLFSSTV